MKCEEINTLLTEYVNHSLNETELQYVEEHLCICQNCRETLASLLDKEEHIRQPKESTSSPANTTTKTSEQSQGKDYFTPIILAIAFLLITVLVILFLKNMHP